ncbi:hypothetical protein ACFELC_00945 [Pseudomonas aeruginosa]|uniref:hypothetical protein n=1 Tax=Pseudomonas aeruginosa TaxID=287 RepID=UPI00383BBAA7
MKLPWSRPLALPPQLEWKYANEPELMSWTVKARNYNTFVENIMFLICLAMVIIGTSFAGDWFQENREKNIPVSIGFFGDDLCSSLCNPPEGKLRLSI